MLNLLEVTTKSLVDSKRLRDNFTDIENFANDLQNQIDTIATPPTGSEVTDARDYQTALRARLRTASKSIPAVIISGGEVVAQGSPDMTVHVDAIDAVIDGVVCKINESNSGTIIAPTTNNRYDIVVVNSDNTLSIVAGTEDADPIYPAIASTQKAIAILSLTPAMTEIISDNITDCREQGAFYMKNGRMQYKFAIQDAIDEIASGEIKIGRGKYIEQIDISGKSDISLMFEAGAKVYRMNDLVPCVKSVNTLGNETSGNKIHGGSFYGNGKEGAEELLVFEYTDFFEIISCRFDGNTGSTATYKNFVLENCDHFTLDKNKILSGGAVDYTTSALTSCSDYVEDGRVKNETIMVRATAERDLYLSKGWSILGAGFDGKFPMAHETDTPESIGGASTINISHGHTLEKFPTEYLNEITYPAHVGVQVNDFPANKVRIISGSAGSQDYSYNQIKDITDAQLSASQDIQNPYFKMHYIYHR
jgi:hypothetical protein